MTTRTKAPVGAPCWVELFTSDPETTRPFYEGLFGWTSESADEEYGGYVNFSYHDELVAGCMRNEGTSPDTLGVGDAWTVYLAVEDAAITAETASRNGGTVLMPAMEVMDLGSMAVLADPGGATIGIWQPGRHAGFGIIGEPSAPSWFELHTRRYNESVKFYRDVFGWDTHSVSDVPEFRYTTLGDGDDQAAGIMDAGAFLPADAPATWSVYFGVDDTDRALGQIAELGGTIVDPAVDTPYGRLATASDPGGAIFKLIADTPA